MPELTTMEIIQRLLLSALMAGMIGYDREFKNRPAGIRTHILVCLGATIIALIQQQIEVEALKIAITQPELRSVVRADPARLIAQVISGIGFLGAGTIIVTKRSVYGLTTAASLWTVACLGLSVGMGYYTISILGFIAIILVLSLLNKLIVVQTLNQIEVKFTHAAETKEFILDYFAEQGVTLKNVDFDIDFTDNGNRLYRNIYTVEIPKDKKHADIIEDLAQNKNVKKIRMINM